MNWINIDNVQRGEWRRGGGGGGGSWGWFTPEAGKSVIVLVLQIVS